MAGNAATRSDQAALAEVRPARGPASRSLLGMLLWTVVSIIVGDLLSIALSAAGIPLASGFGFVLHSVFTAGVLFSTLYFFSIGPLISEVRELERKSEQLQKTQLELERRLTERSAELAELNSKLGNEIAVRKRTEDELRRFTRELEQRVLDRTAKFEAANRELQGQLAEQQKTTDSLRESEKRYRRLVDIAPEGIWTTNAQGQTNFINPRAAQLLGYTVPELLGRRPTDIFFPEDLPANLREFDLQRASQTEPLEFRARHKDGREVWLQGAMTGIVGEQREYLGALLVFADCTARKAAERRLQDQVGLLDQAQDAVVLCDANLHILSWNQGATRLYGWSAEDVLGRDFIEVLGDRAAPLNKDQLIRALQEHGSWRSDVKQRSRDGRPLAVDMRLNVAAGNANRPRTVLVISTDVTEKKRREVQFVREQRIESAARVACGLAHQLNNQLAPILLSAELLRAKRLDWDDQELAASIEASAQSSADFLRQALIFARGTEGERVSIEPGRLIKEVADITREMFPRNIQVVCDVDTNLWNVTGDPSQLHQVLLKLCVNGRDAMTSGGILRLQARNLQAQEGAGKLPAGLKPGCYVVISLHDNGACISPAAQERMFEPFYNAKEPRLPTGLNLPVALGIVKSHGGTITVQSDPATGTTFEVLLPAAVEPAKCENLPLAQEQPGHGELILMVEDEAPLREITRKTLARFGYNVLTASDGVEAVGLLAQHQGQAKLVLTNIVTPSMDGPALVRAVRKLDSGIRVVATSSLGKSLGYAEKLTALQNLGVTRVLAKPYTAEELLRAVRDELAGNAVSNPASRIGSATQG